MKFKIKQVGRKSPGHRFLKKLVESPADMASGISTVTLSSNHNELCDRLKSLLQEKKAGNNSNIIDEETIAAPDKILEYKSTSTKQLRLLLLKCSN